MLGASGQPAEMGRSRLGKRRLSGKSQNRPVDEFGLVALVRGAYCKANVTKKSNRLMNSVLLPSYEERNASTSDVDLKVQDLPWALGLRPLSLSRCWNAGTPK